MGCKMESENIAKVKLYAAKTGRFSQVRYSGLMQNSVSCCLPDLFSLDPQLTGDFPSIEFSWIGLRNRRKAEVGQSAFVLASIFIFKAREEEVPLHASCYSPC